MAESKIIIELKDDSLPKEKPQRGSGGGQRAGGGSPDSPSSRKAERLGAQKRRRERSRGGYDYFGTVKHPAPVPGMGGFKFSGGNVPRVGSMADIGGSAGLTKEEEAYLRRRKYLLNRRRKATRRREERWVSAGQRAVDTAERDANKQRAADIRSENKQRKHRDRLNAKQKKEYEKQVAKAEKEAARNRRTAIVRGTKMQNIASGGARQAAVVAGGGRYGAAIGAAQTFAKFLGPAAGPISIFAGAVGVAAVGLFSLKKAAEVTDKTLMEYADRLSGYSAQVSSANAIADLRRQQIMIRQSSMFGGDLAQFVNQRSIIESQLEDIKTAIITRILPIVNDVMPSISQAVENLGPLVDVLLEMPWDVFGELITLVMRIQGDSWRNQARMLEVQESILDIIRTWLGTNQKAQDEQAAKEINDITAANLAKFLNLTIPPDIMKALEAPATGPSGARANVPAAGLMNPLGIP